MRSTCNDGSAAKWCVAIVCAHDGVRFLAVESSPALLKPRLAAYVSEQALRKLWPAEAALVQQLLSRGAMEAAIDLYFASVGGRWDEEWLHTEGAVQLGERNDHGEIHHASADAARDRDRGTSAVAGA